MGSNLIQAGQSQSEASSECELERTEEEADVAVEGDEVEEDDDTTMSGFEADLSTVSPEVRETFLGIYCHVATYMSGKTL